MSSYTQDHLIEQPAIRLMEHEHELGWKPFDASDNQLSGGK